MFWDNDNDSKDMQRFKNGLFLKMWVSNETRDEAMPGMAILGIVALIGYGIYALFFK